MSESVNVEVPAVGESISEVQIGRWLKSDGDWVEEGEDLVEIETEKASVQIPSPASGTLESILKQEEDFAEVGEVVATIRPGEKGSEPAGQGGREDQAKTEKREPAGEAAEEQPRGEETAAQAEPAAGGQRAEGREDEAAPKPTLEESADREQRASAAGKAQRGRGRETERPDSSGPIVMPAARRLLDEHGIDPEDVPATGPGGRLLKEDVVAYIRHRPRREQAAEPPRREQPAPQAQPPATRRQPEPKSESAAAMTPAAGQRPSPPTSLVTDAAFRSEEVKTMSMLRRTVAARLVEAQQTAALLTTFNEINMQPVMDLRKKYKDAFHEKHGVKLGFMSFFAKAAVEALRRYPAVNAEIRDDNMVFRNYQDIGIAIGGGKGLVVPVLRNVERMSFADVEQTIGEFARQAQENRLQPSDLMGGTFTISNGGIYGSLLSTPIVNPPQSGILGLHAIQERPVAEDGQAVIRPMMYVALTYDHRIVDGREAVGFLSTIKDVIEDPSRLFLEV